MVPLPPVSTTPIELVLYVRPDCDVCEQARGLLKTRQVPWREVDVSSATVPVLRDMYVLGGYWQVPTLMGAGLVQVGFDEPAFHGIIDEVLKPSSGS